MPDFQTLNQARSLHLVEASQLFRCYVATSSAELTPARKAREDAREMNSRENETVPASARCQL